METVRVNSEIDLDQWLRRVEKMLEAPPNSLQATDVLANIEDWDSLAVVRYLAMMDLERGAPLPYEQIVPCITLADLFYASAV